MLDKMISEFNTYKGYDCDGLRDELNSILKACDLGSIGAYDTIDSVDYHNDGSLHITTKYSVRCCAMEDKFEIPAEVMKAEDKISAGKAGLREKKIDQLVRESININHTYEELYDREIAIRKELKELYDAR